MKKLFAISFFMLLISVTTFSQYPYNTGSVTTSSKIWELGAEYEYNCGHDLAQHDIGVRYDGFQNKNNWNIGISYDFGKPKQRTGIRNVILACLQDIGMDFHMALMVIYLVG